MKQIECVVMFVDIVGSTELKYKHLNKGEEVANLILSVYTLIQDMAPGQPKFTGDGAMVVIKDSKHETSARGDAISLGIKILREIEHLNLRFEEPKERIRLKIGIATGKCYKLSGTSFEVSGSIADLAARLCSEADPDTILIDNKTNEYLMATPIADVQAIKCNRMLALKGVKVDPDVDKFFVIQPRLLLRNYLSEKNLYSSNDPFSAGLLALYPDRLSLGQNFSPGQLLELLAQNSQVWIAGRTLISWVQVRDKIIVAIKEKNIKFRFVTMREGDDPYLPDEEMGDHHKDLKTSKSNFENLRNQLGGEYSDHLTVQDVDFPILDSVTCVTVQLPIGSATENSERLLVLQDINAAPREFKACLAIGCTCKEGDKSQSISCMAHGLLERTKRLFGSNIKKRQVAA